MRSIIDLLGMDVIIIDDYIVGVVITSSVA